METLACSLNIFTTTGNLILFLLIGVAAGSLCWSLANICRCQPLLPRVSLPLLQAATTLFIAGFILIGWFHYQIHQLLPLAIPDGLTPWLNQQLAAMNQGSTYGFPLYDPAAPPRYALPLWIENEKYFFWFLCYSLMALIAHRSLTKHRFRAILHLLLGIQIGITAFAANPFSDPLPRFFNEVKPWLSATAPMAKFGLFLKLYPKMIYYYNAEYMWLHPPLLFLAYSAITITFAASCLMLAQRDPAVEKVGYDFAKLGFLTLTLGMLLGYPWALKAWGPNWWWDPKICSSIMLWAVFSTYLHTRLYANKPFMWYFSSFLGILSFAAMIFTFLASYFFPGEHTFQ